MYWNKNRWQTVAEGTRKEMFKKLKQRKEQFHDVQNYMVAIK